MPDTTLTLKANNDDLKAKLAQSEATVQSLTAEVERLEQAGGGDNQLEGDLKKLTDEAYNAKRALEANKQELADFKQKTLDSAKATQEQTGALGGLFGGLSKVQQILGAGAVAVLAFKESFNKTREAIKFFREQFGIDIDAMVKSVDVFGVSLDSLAERIVGLGDKQKQTAQESDNLRNMINVLDNLAIKHDGTIGDVTKKYDEWAASHQRVALATEANTAAFDKFAKSVTGFSAAELLTELEQVKAIQAELAKQGQDENSAFGKALAERVDKATKAVAAYGSTLEKELGPEKAAQLRALAASMASTAVATEDAAKAAEALEKAQKPLQSAIEETRKKLDEEIESLREVRREALKNEGDILAQAEDIKDRIEEATSPDTAGIEALREEIQRLKDEEADLATGFEQSERVWTRQAELFDLIAQKTAQLREAERRGSQIDTKGLEKAQDDFRKLLDAAASDIADLPESARGAAEAIVERFRNINEAAGVSALDVGDFKLEFAGTMAAARLEVLRLGDQAKVTLDMMKEFEDNILAIAKRIEGALAGPLRQFEAILTAMQKITAAAPAMADAMEAAI